MIVSNAKFKLKNRFAYVVGCSAMGKGKIENQDSVQIRQTKNGLIVAVADGLGSLAYSKEGAEKAVKVAADLLEENNFQNLDERLLNLWKNGLEGDIHQYDTTIKFVYVTASKIFVGGVGDGWIALKSKNKIESFVADNDFSNQTDSLLSATVLGKFWMEEFDAEQFSSLVIATDGFSEDIDKANGFKFLSQAEEEIKLDATSFAKELENTLENWPVETNKDDKTAVFVVLTKEGFCE